MVLHEALKAMRIRRDWTLKKMAEDIGIHVETYRRLEGGAEPSMETFTALLRWLLAD
jgi:transcriptional regulator with XRE-family HTH domain